MRAFLDEVAETVYNDYLNKQVRILFPTKRARFYFRKYLGKYTRKASIFNRNLMTIEEFLVREGMRGWNIADELTLLPELYSIVKKLPEQNQIRGTSGFDKFYNLGKIILNDFDEIDKYLIPAGDIFRNLSDLKEIDAAFPYLTDEQLARIRQFWNAFQVNSSQEQQQFLKLWEQLPVIYKQFTQNLIQKKIGYEGLLYRLLAERAVDGSYAPPGNRRFIAVGFNALNTAQEKIFSILQKQGKLQFFRDFDSYYMEDSKQEAGEFLRRNIFIFGNNQAYPELMQQEKDVQVYAVQGNSAQAKMVSSLLEGMSEAELQHTAVVLGDEQLLFPVLSAIPQHIDSINVTMGYPLKHTSLYAFIRRYIALHTGLNPHTIKQYGYYYEDVLPLLRHSYIKGAYPERVPELIEHIYNRQLIYVPQEILDDEEEGLLHQVFQQITEAGQLFTNLLNMLFWLFTSISDQADTGQLINREFIYRSYRAIQRLKDTVAQKLQHLQLSTAVKLLDDHLNGLTIPFEAESQDGLQIMGLMETRNIDFRHVILIGANEGVIPKVAAPPSFISESLRFGYGLPVIAQQDAIFAYVFYRLLQRARSVRILYNNLTSEDNVGEVSRFVKQLKHEAPFPVKQKVVKPSPQPLMRKVIIIEKEEQVLEILRQYLWKDGYAQRALSPSAIANYIACPLRFYYEKIAGIKEPPEVEEEVSYAAFGEILHSALQDMYTRYIRKKGSQEIVPEDIPHIGKNLDDALVKAFKTYYKIPQDQVFSFEGNQRVIKEVLTQYANYILNMDKRYAPFRIHSLEKRFSYSNYITLTGKKGDFRIALSGVIDRVDQKDSIVRIVDYKTGKTETELNNPQLLFQPGKINEYKGLLQILQYSWLYRAKNMQAKGKIRPVLYAVRNMTNPDFTGDIQHKTGAYDPAETDRLLDIFAELLGKKAQEIFDPDIPFTQTDFTKNCEFCPYNTICVIYEK